MKKYVSKCKDCRYFKDETGDMLDGMTDDDIMGTCTRYPPVLVRVVEEDVDEYTTDSATGGHTVICAGYKKYFWLYLPFVFYGTAFDTETTQVVTGWRIAIVGIGYDSWSFQALFGSIVFRTNKTQYTIREIDEMTIWQRLLRSGWF